MAEDQNAMVPVVQQGERPQAYQIPDAREGLHIDYAEQFPQEQLPQETHTRTHNYKAPFGFNPVEQGHTIEDYTLKNLVSSKQARDIVRSSNFMPGQFNRWNEKATGGNNKYVGEFEDLDGDDIDEFVVKRDGKIVAVNGYTTKASDFPFKGVYYNTHPTPESRKDEPYRDYLHSHYYGPVYNDDNSEINRWTGIDPTTAEFKRKFKKHATHAPTVFSPYRAISQLIVAPACKQAFLRYAENNEEKAKILRKAAIEVSGKKAFEAAIASQFYTTMVKVPLLQSIQDQVQALSEEFVTIKQRSNPDFVVDWTPGSECVKKFETWLFNKASVKARVKTFVHNLITTDNGRRQQNIEALRAKLVTSFTNNQQLNERYRQLWTEKQEAIGNAFDFQ